MLEEYCKRVSTTPCVPLQVGTRPLPDEAKEPGKLEETDVQLW